MGLSYVLPIRRRAGDAADELTDYLAWLGAKADVVVVDNSEDDAFEELDAVWSRHVRHLRPDPDLTYAYPKVNNVLTGVRHARHDKVVVADDDVRWDGAGLDRVAELLDDAELVRPQNYFDPLPWHARWDTGRTLLNRAFGADFPGTLAVRRSFLLDIGGYDGDCLFENLELIRSVAAGGGRVASPLDLYVRRLPPSSSHFWSQRVRQAYDDFALPHRMATWLALVPAAVLAWRRRPSTLLAGAMASVALAERGRRRARGQQVFPASSAAWAPVWLAERSVCAWLALWQRATRGGVPYAGTVLRKAANRNRD